MFLARMVALILVIPWLWPTSLHAQSEALVEAVNQGQTLYEAGRIGQRYPLRCRSISASHRKYEAPELSIATANSNGASRGFSRS